MRRERFGGFLVTVIGVLALAGLASAAGVIYVDDAATGAGDGSSWSDAYVHLQDALAAAASAAKPVEIRVAQGVYRPDEGTGVTPGDQDATFELINGVALMGGYAGIAGEDPDIRDPRSYETVLQGDLDDDSLGRACWGDCVVTGSLTDATAVIEGITITRGCDGMVIDEGSPTLRRVLFRENNDGLVLVGASPSVTDCTFIDNDDGIRASDCNAVLSGCRFERNERAVTGFEGHLALTDCVFINSGQALNCHAVLDLNRCLFEANTGVVGALRSLGVLTARRCAFVANDRAAVYCGGDATFLDCEFRSNSMVGFAGAVNTVCQQFRATRCVFAGNSSEAGAGAITNYGVHAQLSQCLFVGNSGGQVGVGAINSVGHELRVSNCTFADNRGIPRALYSIDEVTTQMTGCIVWDGTNPFSKWPGVLPPMQIEYSNVQGGHESLGNIDVDPEFVQPGYWADPNDRTIELGPDNPRAVWVMGDYHLKSQAGHWDTAIEDWVYDETTSPCIDTADPNAPLGDELFPNGGYLNMGAYGGTTQASRTYFGGSVCETQIAGDINGDCVVDQIDPDILLSHWLAEGE